MRPFDNQTRAIMPFKETVAAPKSFFRENMALRINCRTIASLIVRKFPTAITLGKFDIEPESVA